MNNLKINNSDGELRTSVLVALIINLLFFVGAIGQYSGIADVPTILTYAKIGDDALFAIVASSCLGLVSLLLGIFWKPSLISLGFNFTGTHTFLLSAILVQNYPPLNVISLMFLVLSVVYVTKGSRFS